MPAHGRLAVQPFLVIGGFLTALSLQGRAGHATGPLIWQRYLRLAPQFVVALVLVVLATLLVGGALAHEDWVSPLPSVGEFLAHAFLLHDLLGVPALSAGAWYVAIDFQLFVLLVLLARTMGSAGPSLAASPGRTSSPSSCCRGSDSISSSSMPPGRATRLPRRMTGTPSSRSSRCRARSRPRPRSRRSSRPPSRRTSSRTARAPSRSSRPRRSGASAT